MLRKGGTRTPTILLPPAPQAGRFAVLQRTDAYSSDGCWEGACWSERLRRLYSHTLGHRDHMPLINEVLERHANRSYFLMNSTRRLLALPAAVSFLSIGWLWPLPPTSRRAASILNSPTSAVFTDAA